MLGIATIQNGIARYGIAKAYDAPYSETQVTGHGKGLPLFVGLGWSSNPYNLTWDDFAGSYIGSLMLDRNPRPISKSFDDWLMDF